MKSGTQVLAYHPGIAKEREKDDSNDGRAEIDLKGFICMHIAATRIDVDYLQYFIKTCEFTLASYFSL